MLLNIFLLFMLYVITAYLHICLYKKGVTIFIIRIFLLVGIVLYSIFLRQPNTEWSNLELGCLAVIAAAHLLTVNAYTLDDEEFKNFDEIQHQEQSRSSGSLMTWLAGFFFLSWLFGDDSNDDGLL